MNDGLRFQSGLIKPLGIAAALLALWPLSAGPIRAASGATEPPGGSRATLEGQVVCFECWHEADRATTPYGTEADLACARKCEKKGLPQALAVAESDDWVLYVLREVAGGSVDASDWFPLVGERARVTGVPSGSGEERAIAVESIEALQAPGGEAPSMEVPGAATGPPESRADGGLSLVDLSGHPQTLSALRGRVVVLNFWASWCLPCRQEMPDLVGLQTELGAEGVAVVGASADPPEAEPVVRKFLSKTPVNFPVWLGATTQDMSRFGVGPDLPATIVLDREGRVVERFHGRIKRDSVSDAVRLALSGDSPRAAGAKPAGGIAGAPPRVSSVPS